MNELQAIHEIDGWATVPRSLPTAADVAAIEDALQRAFDLTERVEWALSDLSEQDSTTYPRPVTHKTMGVLAELRASLVRRIDDFQRLVDTLDGAAMFQLSACRVEQAAGRVAGVDV